VLVPALNESFTLFPGDLSVPLALAGVSSGPLPGAASGPVPYLAWQDTLLQTSLQSFSAASPLALSECNKTTFQLWHLVPVMDLGGASVALFGDTTKYVPVSPQRVAGLAVAPGVATLALVGAPGELVPVTFATTTGALRGAAGAAGWAISTATCTLGADGRASLALPTGLCAAA
jgi:hypothetical protein